MVLDEEVEVADEEEEKKMDYTTRLNSALDLLRKHYIAVIPPESKYVEDFVNTKLEQFTNTLKNAGGTDEEGLKEFSYEDLQKFGAPLALARRIARIFRETPQSSTALSTAPSTRPRPMTAARAGMLSIEELVAAYDPRAVDSPVTERLLRLSDGKPCVVFEGDTINVKASLACLSALIDGEEPFTTYSVRTSYSSEPRPQPVYPIGVRPNVLVDENPLYPGRTLRSDGTCTQTNRSWEGVSQVVRTLLYIACSWDTAKGRELLINRLDDAHAALDLAVSENAEEKIRARYPIASVRYDKFAEAGELPRLKIARGPSGLIDNNPFPGNRVR